MFLIQVEIKLDDSTDDGTDMFEFETESLVRPYNTRSYLLFFDSAFLPSSSSSFCVSLTRQRLLPLSQKQTLYESCLKDLSLFFTHSLLLSVCVSVWYSAFPLLFLAVRVCLPFLMGVSSFGTYSVQVTRINQRLASWRKLWIC